MFPSVRPIVGTPRSCQANAARVRGRNAVPLVLAAAVGALLGLVQGFRETFPDARPVRGRLQSHDRAATPGDIDPRRSVLIGDLGHEMPFALDFRTSWGRPRVVYLTIGTDRWIPVAPDAEVLLDRLGLSGKNFRTRG
ncbi:hypothetical protein [Actinoallomurus sp. CA-142502]|uniref:hypothetical protein n=1 Tax=Actinoallomurus sp. CA-142502 TaxID=3239885 RepID=UPI003D8C2134